MTRLERLAIWALLTLGFCGCTRTTETRSESAVQATAAVQEKASSTLDEVVQTGPSTTTVYKFALPESGKTKAGLASSDPSGMPPDQDDYSALVSSARHSVATGRTVQRTDHLPTHGALVEMDVIQTGPVLDTKRQTSAEASSATQTVKSEEKATTKTKTAPALSLYVWLALAVVVLALIGWAAWKMSPLGKIL